MLRTNFRFVFFPQGVVRFSDNGCCRQPILNQKQLDELGGMPLAFLYWNYGDKSSRLRVLENVITDKSQQTQAFSEPDWFGPQG